MGDVLMVVDNEFDSDPRVINEVRVLTQEGIHVHVLCLSKNEKSHINIKGSTVHRVSLNKKWRGRLFYFNNTFPLFNYYWSQVISKYLKYYSFQALHVHDLYMLPSALKAKRKSKTKAALIVDLHENFPEAVKAYKWANGRISKFITRPNKFKYIERNYLNKADRIIVLSEYFRDQLLEKYVNINRRDICIYGNAPDVEKLSSYERYPNLISKNGNRIVFYFGNVSKRRGIFTLIQALKYLLKEKYNVKLLIIGPVDKAEKEYFNTVVSDPQVSENIIYYQWKDISLLPSYVEQSDICVSPIVKNPQHESGIANKVFQYMLFKKPVIVSDCKPQQDVIEKSKAGLVFESENARDLANKISYLLENEAEAISMGESGRNAVMNRYNLSMMSQGLINMYKTILDR